MYREELKTIAGTAKKKNKMLTKTPAKYALSCMLGGVYVAFGTMLSYSMGAGLQTTGSAYAYKIVMGLAFGIALCLVIFAGADLYTSNNMVMAIGATEKETTWIDAFKLWGFCWIGNLIGSVIAGWLFVNAGLFNDSAAEFIVHYVEMKTGLTLGQMLIRGILCNMLVCLASWCSYKMKNEAAKVLMIAWCVFAFFTAGYEHSIANMGLFAIGLFLPQGSVLALSKVITSLIVVTIGNTIGGAVIVGLSYVFMTNKEAE
ncbi:hydrosulfide channel, FNT family [Clostridium sp. DSM 8431]|uniref:formate/nitrite transporter family protein n=1 Tax=Clostridium sp. DSM 8431 TaxID=1761781 RepID=UPI0008EA273C|nr:formate/nitrite transporter family protein [Clostridium sp. DSM 8431]SFU55292.1 hydrosulfide channel, FNT family [Clostridium sp. DSM 8431]